MSDEELSLQDRLRALSEESSDIFEEAASRLDELEGAVLQMHSDSEIALHAIRQQEAALRAWAAAMPDMPLKEVVAAMDRVKAGGGTAPGPVIIQ